MPLVPGHGFFRGLESTSPGVTGGAWTSASFQLNENNYIRVYGDFGGATVALQELRDDGTWGDITDYVFTSESRGTAAALPDTDHRWSVTGITATTNVNALVRGRSSD